MNPQDSLDPNAPHPTEPLLEASLIQRKQIGDDTNSLLEALVHQGETNNPEHLLAAGLVQSKQNTDRIVEAIAPGTPRTTKISDMLNGLFDEMKGDQGEKGEQGPKGDQGEKGDQGDPGPDGPIGPQGAQGLTGADGADGRDGRDGRDGVDGSDGEKGDQGDPGKDGSPDTAEQIRQKMASILADLEKKVVKQSAKKMTLMIPNQGYFINSVYAGQGENLNLIAGSNVTLAAVPSKNGIDITITASGGGGASLNPQTPVGTINGSNATFTITGILNALFLNGAFQTPGGVDYTLAGTTITYVSAPPAGSNHYSI